MDLSPGTRTSPERDPPDRSILGDFSKLITLKGGDSGALLILLVYERGALIETCLVDFVVKDYRAHSQKDLGRVDWYLDQIIPTLPI